MANMTPDPKKQNLIKQIEFLLKKLKENNILSRRAKYEGGYEESEWYRVNPDDPGSTFLGGICSDKRAFTFLKGNGYIDNGVCWDCGEEPIINRNTFTDKYDPSIQYFICEDCYNRGRNHQKNFGYQNKSNCYIATVCYGDINAIEVQELRYFRDHKLSKTKAGRFFINFYYVISPYIASKLKNKKQLNNLIRIYILDKIINFIRK